PWPYRPYAAPVRSGRGRTGDADDNTRPAYPTTANGDTHSPECRCSIRVVELPHDTTVIVRVEIGNYPVDLSD
ncbi:hypothetical protein, partial [Nocardia abscessus]|uniref:hypothetical protein n=1 Tax=Nocardia abscessus TaxID=120957 RepID=UPI0024537AA8